MNRYIIVSKAKSNGSYENDSHSLHDYFELGWEVATTHLDTKFLFSNGTYDKGDIIVTQSERKFFYEGLFDNVISCSEHVNRGVEEIDMVQNALYHNLRMGIKSNTDLVWEGQKIDDNILFSFNYSDLNPSTDYACLVYRKRRHDSHRNMDDTYFIHLINFLRGMGLYVYVIGYGSEKFADFGAIYVNLRDWATLINKDKCKIIVTTLTGPTNLINFCGNPNTDIFIIELGADRGTGESRIVMGDCLNFKGLEYNYIKNLDLEYLKKIINEKCI